MGMDWGGAVCVTYLPLGSIAIEMGLGGVPSVVHIEVGLKVDHLSVKLYESVGRVYNKTREMEGGVVRRGGKRYRWGWDGERRS